jgi:ubiquinone/menaquinone biosynthesis C-methylase UbiE
VNIRTLHTDFFDVIARVLPGLEDLHYGVQQRPPRSAWGMLGRLRGGSRALLERAAQAADLGSLPRGEWALDLGCGLGGTSRFLAQRYGFRALGVNLNPAQLALAARRLEGRPGSERVALAAGDVQRLPLAEGCAGLAVLIEVAFHVPDKPALFDELARVLRPGGRVLLIDQERAQAADLLGMFHFVSFGSYQRLAEAAGLTLLTEQDLSPLVANWMQDYARAAGRPFHAAAATLAFLRGGPSLARAYLAGVRAFDGLIRSTFAPEAGAQAGRSTGIQALRQRTRQELLDGRSRYCVWVFEKGRG